MVGGGYHWRKTATSIILVATKRLSRQKLCLLVGGRWGAGGRVCVSVGGSSSSVITCRTVAERPESRVKVKAK